MSSSIRRGGHWWNQAPDGTWLRWSQQNSAWEPQQGAPPPPDAPPPPPPPLLGSPAGAPTPAATSTQPAGPVATMQPIASETPDSETQPAPEPQAVQPEGPAPAQPARQASEGPERGQTATGETAQEPPAPSSQKANAPIFSSARRSIAPVFENKKIAAVAGVLAVVMVFAATYTGASLFFRNVYGSEVAHADERGDERMSPEKARYIARLDKMCAKDGDLSGLQNRILAVDSPAEMERLFDKIESKYRRHMAKVLSIEKPKQDRKLLDRILALQRQALPFLDRLLAAFQARDETLVQTLAAEAYANAGKSQRLMEEYGFQVCGQI